MINESVTFSKLIVDSQTIQSMSQRDIPVPIKELNAIMIFLSQIFSRLRLYMINYVWSQIHSLTWDFNQIQYGHQVKLVVRIHYEFKKLVPKMYIKRI